MAPSLPGRSASGPRRSERARVGGLLTTAADLARSINFIRYDVVEHRRVTRGLHVRMAPNVSIRNGSRISLGAGAHVGQGCFLWAGDTVGRIEIGQRALLAPGVFVTSSDYDFGSRGGAVYECATVEADVVIGPDTWLGANVVVLAGVHVGAGTIVAAGAVVTRDLPENCLAAGVPAAPIRHGVRPQS